MDSGLIGKVFAAVGRRGGMILEGHRWRAWIARLGSLDFRLQIEAILLRNGEFSILDSRSASYL